MSKFRNEDSMLIKSFEETGENRGRWVEKGSEASDDLYRVERLFVTSDTYVELTDIAGMFQSVNVGND